MDVVMNFIVVFLLSTDATYCDDFFVRILSHINNSCFDVFDL